MLYDRTFHLYIRSTCLHKPCTRLSVSIPSKPSKIPAKWTSPAPGQWAIPIGVSEKAGVWEVAFHPDSLTMGRAHAAFARQMEQTTFAAVRRRFAAASGLAESAFVLSCEAEERDWAALLAAPKARLSQHRDSLVITWPLPFDAEEELNLLTPAAVPDTAADIVRFADDDFARLTLFPPGSISPVHVFARLERGRSVDPTSMRVRVSRRSLTWHLKKTPSEAGSHPWLHLYVGPDRGALTLVRFPETSEVQATAAIRRSQACLERQARSHRRSSRAHAAMAAANPRPITLLYRGPDAAFVSIQGWEAPLSVETTTAPASSSSSPESGIGSLESRDDATDKDAAAPFRHRSYSEATLPAKGILKRHTLILRSVSECEAAPESPFASLDELASSGNSEARRKSVRFSERIIKHCFKSSSSIVSIVGEGKNRSKKNQKRKEARLRRSSTGSSHGESTDAGSDSDALVFEVRRHASTDTEDKAVQFTIDPIPELPGEDALRKRSSRDRPLSFSDDEEEELERRVQSPNGPPTTPDFDSDGDEQTAEEAEEPTASPVPAAADVAADKKRKKKKKRKGRKAAAKEHDHDEDGRKQSHDSGIGLEVA